MVVVPNGGAPAADAGLDRPAPAGPGGPNANAQQESKPHTFIVEGKPEPGHDVFAAQGDAKSVSVVVEKAAGGEQKETTKKEVSTVGVAGPGGVHGPVVGGTEKSGKEKEKETVVLEEKKKEKDAAVVEGEKKKAGHEEDKKSDTEKTTAASTVAVTATEAKGNPKPEGPLNEAEQEADRVAQELFPES